MDSLAGRFLPQASAIDVVLTVLTAVIGLFARRLLARTELPGMAGEQMVQNQPGLLKNSPLPCSLSD
jgi:hypothetical protein